MTESEIQKRAVNLCNKLRLCYIGTPNNAKKRNYKQTAWEKGQGLVTGHPDLSVLELGKFMPYFVVENGIPTLKRKTWGSLCLEIKTEQGGVFTQKGELRQTPHIRQQAQRLSRLMTAGQFAVFAEGWDSVENLILWWGKRLDVYPVFQPYTFAQRGGITKDQMIYKLIGWREL